ncbi:MAG: hypothetical protein WBV94_01560 [Blastocatellia bacterium]
MLICLKLYSLFAVVLFTFIQSSVYTPKPGSPERKQIMDALRVPVETALKKTVEFKVDHLKVKSNWAFLRGVPRQPGGKKMDYKGTEYQSAIDDGVFDDWICAILKKEKDKWKVVRYVIGATDVAYEGWDEEFGIGPDIFQ